ncbi:MAG: hypothetical protein IJO98_10480 [Clostridia bacterium]|nr:hypothetical protein [Clostridia bacterium]
MKRALIGGFLALLGTIWGLAVIIAAGSNLVSSWDPAIGRLLSTIHEMKLALPFYLSIAVTIFGAAVLFIEFFRKD